MCLKNKLEIKDKIVSLDFINKQYSKNKNFTKYLTSIQNLFCIENIPTIKESTKYFLGGFVAGEGSLNISAKKTSSGTFMLILDPEFSVTQHINGIHFLITILCVFKTGRLRYKKGSKATFCVVVDNRKSLKEKVMPFYKKYVISFSSGYLANRVYLFNKFLTLMEEKAHLDQCRMIQEVLPLWDSLRVQIGHKNQTFKNLKEAQTYVVDSAASDEC